MTVPSHPAKWSQPILDALGTLGLRGPVLDPFAGVGVGRLAEAIGLDVVGLEIEPLWAAAHPLTVCGNALQPPFRPGRFRSMVTSCTYGNRMADHHNAKERCRACDASGEVPGQGGMPAVCPKCDGLGRRSYTRLTYRHQYGDDLHPDNSGAFHWGPKYRAFHARAWATLLPLLTDDAVFVLNVKDHWKTETWTEPSTRVKKKAQVRQEVTAWHRETVEAMGWTVDRERSKKVHVPGMRMGQNREAREEFESVLVFERSAA